MTDMRASAAPPSIGDLINSGVDYAKSAKATIPYVAAAIAALILPAILGPTLGGILGAICGVGTIFIAVMASREAITGEFAYKDSDPMAVLKLVGLSILVVIALMILAIPLAMIFSGGVFGLLLFYLILMAIIVAALARIGFLLPALSMNDPVSIQSVLDKTAPYWTSLIALLAVTALPNILFNALFGGVGGFFGVILTLIGVAISVVIGLVAIGAISRLYAQRARTA